MTCMEDIIHDDILRYSGAGFTNNDIQGILWMKHNKEVNEKDIAALLDEYHAYYDNDESSPTS
jgi:hypothetical protein